MMSQQEPPRASQHVPLSTRYQIINEQRVVLFTGRDPFALNDTVIAVPFALLKFLAGSLVTAEGQAELARGGGQIHAEPPQGTAL